MPRKYVVKPKTKVVQCRVCTCDMTVGWKTKKAMICGYCAVRSVRENATQLHEKHGPHYDVWLKAMRDYLSREITARGVSLENVPPSQDS